jgi:hypothetical protein
MTRAETIVRNKRIAWLVKFGWTHREIGELFGLEVSSVATLCHRHRIRAATSTEAIDQRNAIIAQTQRTAWADPIRRAKRVAAIRKARGLPELNSAE